MAVDLVLRCSPAERELGLEVARELERAGFEVAAPDLGAAAAPVAARGCVLLVTSGWARSPELRRALAAARAAAAPIWVAWWDEDAPSDFLGDSQSDDLADILYLCLLPRSERIPRLVRELRAGLETS